MIQRLLVAGAALALFAVLVVLTRSDNEPGSSGPPKPSGKGGESRFDLIDVDERGAIVSDAAARTILGLDASGHVIWRDRKAFRDESDVVCMSFCPDAAISGSTQSFNSPGVADPPVRWRTAGRVVTERRPRRQLKARVLWARSSTDSVALRGDGRSTRLELHRPQQVRRLTVESVDTTFDVARRQGRALAFTASSDGSDSALRWFERGSAGWRKVGPTQRSPQAGVCLAVDGEQAVLEGGPPATTRFAGAKVRPLAVRLGRSQDRTSNCAVAGAGIALTAPVGQDGGASLVAFIDSSGKQRWTKRFAGPVGTLAVHPSRPAVAISGDRTLTVLDGSGRRLLERAGVDDAEPLGSRIAIVTDRGEVQRLSYPGG